MRTKDEKTGLIRFQRVRDSKIIAARKLRKEMTESEQLLWQEIRGKKLDGFKFRRQQIIDGFIVDFYCPKVKLVVEVDGPVHSDPEQAELDQRRSAVFVSEHNLQVLRITNDEIMADLTKVLSKIHSECLSLLTPLPFGRGVPRGSAAG